MMNKIFESDEIILYGNFNISVGNEVISVIKNPFNYANKMN